MLIALSAGPAYPQNRDILQLQKDMIDLQQLVKQLQGSLDRNNEVTKSLLERTADQVNTLAVGMQKITQTVDGLKNQSDTTSINGITITEIRASSALSL